MPDLIICKGLPGSGKTTWALKQVQSRGNTIRVNRDSLRLMLHGTSKYTVTRERMTIQAEREIARAALLSNQHVIVDDTNMKSETVRDWFNFADVLINELQLNIDISIEDFTTVSLGECIERDRMRENNVGRAVIENMALRSGGIPLEHYNKVVICDIDGTLANLDHRLNYIQGDVKDYDTFYERSKFDTVFTDIADAVNKLASEDYTILMLSGRPEKWGRLTDAWLRTNRAAMGADVHFHHLFMRPSSENRADHLAKGTMMQTLFEKGLRKEAIKLVIDDRESVCNVWREMGLPLVQVDHGAMIQVEPSAMHLAVNSRIPINYDPPVIQAFIDSAKKAGCNIE